MVEIESSINFVKGSLPKPTTQKSSGIRIPCSFNSCIAPSAAKSLEEKIASGDFFRLKNFFTANLPESKVLLVQTIP